ncbi:DUF6279 family lipoprotein [Shewanella sp. NIFS-20-20]|uniref:DUF6279 family lipoprotein n=1 Tax=Shewanella sp. NIFS-20-20 TaxID=2853806 RepID=UPI001C43C1A3|nr:DUF6279 family lipoprotein [Shewanella sp. NIFS-20-20]MBV7317100.1 hypothetical protein [Shewanella sp. NIFS-20-20]
MLVRGFLLKILIITVCLLGLGACSTKMSYYFLDWAIEWEVDDYVDLNDEQQQALAQAIDEFILWHQANELPRYSQHLTQVIEDIATPSLEAERWLHHSQLGKAHWQRLVAFNLEAITALIASLSDAQVAQIDANIRRQIAEDKDKYLNASDEDWLKRNDENLLERAEDLLGELSVQQRLMIRKYNRNRPRTTALWYRYQDDWSSRFISTIQHRQDPVRLHGELVLLFTAADTLKAPEYQQALVQNRLAMGELLQQLHASLTTNQQRKVVNKLQDLIADLNDLSAAGMNNLALNQNL